MMHSKNHNNSKNSSCSDYSYCARQLSPSSVPSDGYPGEAKAEAGSKGCLRALEDTLQQVQGERRKIYKSDKINNGYCKHGFTLIEVILALAITGLVLTPVFIIYTTILQRVTKASKQLSMIVYGKTLLSEARQKQEPDAQEFKLEKPVAEFDATVKYQLDKAVDQKSVLASLPGLHREVVTVEWTDLGEKQQERLVTFVYKKPEQKKS